MSLIYIVDLLPYSLSFQEIDHTTKIFSQLKQSLHLDLSKGIQIISKVVYGHNDTKGVHIDLIWHPIYLICFNEFEMAFCSLKVTNFSQVLLCKSLFQGMYFILMLMFVTPLLCEVWPIYFVLQFLYFYQVSNSPRYPCSLVAW